jgi:cytochrome oxidase assembly protein ShyY1
VWRPVRVRGVYEPDRTVLVRNRPLDGVYGYEVVVPLRTATGSLLLVDRGWVPNGATGAEPDAVPAPAAGAVEVVGRLRPGEPPLDRDPPPGQELRIDLARITARLGEPVYGTYAVLAHESPEPASRPAPLPAPELDLGPHLAYAVQWWGFAAAAYVLLGYYLLEEARRRADADGSTGPGPQPEPARAVGGHPVRRSRRREPTDEEWEDAADR